MELRERRGDQVTGGSHGDDFTVNLVEVRAHASAVATIAAQVNSISRVTREAMGGGTYGMVGEFFASAITQACGDVRGTIAGAGHAVHDVRSGLGLAADAYQQTDDLHASLLTAIGSEELR